MLDSSSPRLDTFYVNVQVCDFVFPIPSHSNCLILSSLPSAAGLPLKTSCLWSQLLQLVCALLFPFQLVNCIVGDVLFASKKYMTC